MAQYGSSSTSHADNALEVAFRIRPLVLNWTIGVPSGDISSRAGRVPERIGFWLPGLRRLVTASMGVLVKEHGRGATFVTGTRPSGDLGTADPPVTGHGASGSAMGVGGSSLWRSRVSIVFAQCDVLVAETSARHRRCGPRRRGDWRA